jgi:GT2 family glycosyltransferase
MIKVFIIILNWNRPDDTLECLKSVNKLSVKGYKLSVVVVDNASSDDSVKRLKSFEFKKGNYSVIVNKSNLGYTGGMNKGMKYAIEKDADFITVLNNDTVLDKKIIREFLKAAKKYPKAAAFGPKIYFAKGFEFHKKRYKKTQLGKVIWYAGGDIDWDNVYATNHGVDEVDKGQFDQTRETDFVTGNCLFLRSSALKDTGLLDDKYFMYIEDVDLCYRLKNLGWKILYIPKAKLWHKVAQSSRIGSELNDYYTTRNRLLFGMRYAGWRTRFALYRESLKHLLYGRKWQKQGVIDFYFANFGRGSWKDEKTKKQKN